MSDCRYKKFAGKQRKISARWIPESSCKRAAFGEGLFWDLPGMWRTPYHGCIGDGCRYFGRGTAIGTPAGATITSASLFGANDATRPGFMVLRAKGLSRFHAGFFRRANAGPSRVNRAFAEAFIRPRQIITNEKCHNYTQWKIRRKRIWRKMKRYKIYARFAKLIIITNLARNIYVFGLNYSIWVYMFFYGCVRNINKNKIN